MRHLGAWRCYCTRIPSRRRMPVAKGGAGTKAQDWGRSPTCPTAAFNYGFHPWRLQRAGETALRQAPERQASLPAGSYSGARRGVVVALYSSLSCRFRRRMTWGLPTHPSRDLRAFVPWGYQACPKLESKGGQAQIWGSGAPHSPRLHPQKRWSDSLERCYRNAGSRRYPCLV